MEKVFDTTGGTYAFSSTASITALNLMIAGPAYTKRTTNRVYLTKVGLHLQITPTATTSQVDFGRVMIVYDKCPNGALAAVKDIIHDANTLGADTSFSHYNYENLDERFTIIMDKKVYLPSLTDTAGVLTNFQIADPIEQSLRICECLPINKISRYNNTNGGTIADITTGALLLVVFSNIAAGSTGWEVQGSLRVHFVDI